MKFASKSAMESDSSAKEGSKSSRGASDAPIMLALPDSRNDDLEEGRSGVVGRERGRWLPDTDFLVLLPACGVVEEDIVILALEQIVLGDRTRCLLSGICSGSACDARCLWLTLFRVRGYSTPLLGAQTAPRCDGQSTCTCSLVRVSYRVPSRGAQVVSVRHTANSKPIERLMTMRCFCGWSGASI